MEGLIPFVYKAFVQYKNGKEGALGSLLFNESPSYSYMRLPAAGGGDSGRFQTSASALLSDHYGFTSSSSSSTTQGQASSSGVVQSPRRRLTARRASAKKSA